MLKNKLKLKLSSILLASTVVMSGCTNTAAEKTIVNTPTSIAEDYNLVLGTQTIGGYYKFTDDNYLTEQVKHVEELGSNVLKVTLAKRAPKVYKMKNQKKVNSTLELFLQNEEFKQAFDMDFKYVFAWVHTLTGAKWTKGFTPAQEKAIYDEMYEFSEYLLTEYSNTGKVFMLGNWEGDWLLHPGYNRKYTPSKERTDNMAKWFNIRQKAVDDAKRNVKHTNVELYHYVEVNLALKAIEGKPSITESVLPQTNVDMVSYSSYEAIKQPNYKAMKAKLGGALDYIESKLKPKAGIPFSRRVFVGEYGYHANKKKPKSFIKQFNKTREVAIASMELDVPFSLHWQMYNNEYTDKGASKEMSLIDEQGQKQPLYYFHKAYWQQMKNYVKNQTAKNGSAPSKAEFNKQAIKTIRNLNWEKIQKLKAKS